jgi:HEAT repeat protein
MRDSLLLPDLIEYLSSPDDGIRSEAIAQLSSMGKFCTPHVIPLLQTDNLDAILGSLEVLRNVQDLKAVNIIIELLDHSNFNIRRKANNTLKAYGKSAERNLVNKLASRTNKQKIAILDLLTNFDRIKKQDEVITCLSDTDPVVRQKSARLIGHIGIKKGVDPLLESLKDDDWRVRLQSAYSLGLIGQKSRVVDALIYALTDENSHVQAAAVTALGDLGSKDSIEPLMNLLDTSDELLLQATIISLGKCSAKKSIEKLIELYESGDKYTQHAIVQALGNLGGKESYTVLEDALQNEDLAIMAVYSLHRIGTKKAYKLLNKHRNSDLPNVQKEISWILHM